MKKQLLVVVACAATAMGMATSAAFAGEVTGSGKPTAAVLYISVPGTHRQWDYVVNEVLAGVRRA